MKKLLDRDCPKCWRSDAPALLVFVHFFDDAVTAIGIKHHAGIVGRALGHCGQTGPREQRIRPHNFQIQFDPEHCSHVDRGCRLLFFGPVVILEGNNDVEIVMVIDAQMPVRAKRIQYFDDRLFKAIHAAQTGELPFPKPGSGGAQGNLPLSVRAMPMTPPANGFRGAEADVERAHQVAGGRPSGQTHFVPKKTAPVVQAVVAEEQRQMVMDFGSPVADVKSVTDLDETQIRSAVDGLDAMEAMLRERVGEN